MDVVKEVKLLKYQMSLMKHMVNAEEHPFFMFAIDHEFEENQVNAFLKALGVFSLRIKGEDISVLYQDDYLFSQFNLPLDNVYTSSQPTLEELELYVSKIFYQKFELKYLLYSLKKQFIQTEVCDFFLQRLKTDLK
ncbi:DUF1878 domain-containing protein [Priestia megaterium]|uniref:hypothetical protein n=1 Tax=Priestia megaterium TaxID=1404 RepID=UPI0007C54072|nr:hypothetical protein [Priestia megaterium]MCI4622905.1 DUF1878 domain-containing protein [Priestia megaterium]MED3830371.1 DUF1878 domain-containing protein [Priestia megaterium]MED4131290.1 DUF1878 domain-containing protein [Priestia megaterium]OAD49280.1 hypothetical protein AT960_18420 [Priestia megaterium]PGZ70915.1 DUF1878 domain-containing protein [Priestia megaterium]